MLKLRIVQINKNTYKVEYFVKPIFFLGIKIRKGGWKSNLYYWYSDGIKISSAGSSITGSFSYCQSICEKYYSKQELTQKKVVKTYLEPAEEKKNNIKQISLIINKLRELEDSNPEIDSILEELENLN